MAVHNFVTRWEREPENDRPGLMAAFDEIVTGPVDSIHIERMTNDTYWMAFYRGESRQVVVIHSASGRAKIIARTDAE